MFYRIQLNLTIVKRFYTETFTSPIISVRCTKNLHENVFSRYDSKLPEIIIFQCFFIFFISDRRRINQFFFQRSWCFERNSITIIINRTEWIETAFDQVGKKSRFFFFLTGRIRRTEIQAQTHSDLVGVGPRIRLGHLLFDRKIH